MSCCLVLLLLQLDHGYSVSVKYLYIKIGPPLMMYAPVKCHYDLNCMCAQQKDEPTCIELVQ